MSADVPVDDSRYAGVDPNSRWDVWIKKLLYPQHTLPVAAAPVLVGVGLAIGDGVYHLRPVLTVLLFGWLVQLGGVLADNYFNLVRYHDDEEHPALVHALDTGLLQLAEIKRATAATFATAALVGGYMVVLGGLPVIVVGFASMLVSLFYSLEVTDLPVHDLYFFLFFGPVSVAGTYYLQAAVGHPIPVFPPTGSLPIVAGLAGVPIGALITNILVVDNVRDLEFDRRKADPTLALVIGRGGSFLEYGGLLVLAYLVPIALWATGAGPAVLLPLLSLPYAILVTRRFVSAETYREMLPLSPQTGRVLLAFATLFGIGLAL